MVSSVRAAGRLLLLATCLLPMTVSGVTLTCPDGWNQLYAKCYLVVSQVNTNWDAALRTCQRHGGVLAEPSGYKLTKEAGALVRAADPALTTVWIGYNRRGLSTDATHGLWSDGRSATVAAGAWGHQEPDISAGHCTYMQRGTDGLWYWYMANCDHDLPFVCQATPCPDTTFRCDNGRCVGRSNVCNKENNCGDESDERNCPAQCSYYVKEQSGSLIYPSSGSLYLPTQTCQWVIQGALGTKLQLQFVSLNTEKNLDFVEVWVGGNTISTSSLVQRISGKVSDFSSIGLTVSSNNVAVVRFLSDGNYQDSGFRLTWQSTFQCSVVTKAGYSVSTFDNPYSKQQTTLSACSQQCNSETQCVAYSYDSGRGECSRFNVMPVPVASTCCTLYVKTCPASSGFPNLPSIPGQGGQLYGTSNLQRFYSPLYPTYYLGDLSKKWVINSPGRQIITLQVLDLDLAAGDMITVYDGSDTSATELATMSGSVVTAADAANVSGQARILSTGSTMMIELKTHYPSNRRGFLFGYQAGCSFSIVANGGRVVSPGYKSGLYPNILNCQWIIEAEAGRSLTLNFDSTFGLENGKDYLQVTANGSSVHSGSGFTGSNPPTRVIAGNGRIELIMQTGATGQSTGFGATFNAGCSSINDTTLKTTYTANYGQSVVIECVAERVFASPYTGQNSVGLFCLENGQWSHSPLPTCTRVFCGPPVDISNGFLVSVTGVNSGDTATYRCEDGFQLSTNVPSIVCRSNRHWDNAPFCFSSRSCPAISALIFGSTNMTSGSGFDHGSVVNFNCTNPLYELNGSPNLLCQNGSWSGGFPTCERIPCSVPYIANGSVTPSSNLYDGQPLTVICNRGFQLTGASIFNCGDTPPACINVNECQSGSGCSQNCTDTVGSYYCSCTTGYLLQPDGRTCSDMDECSVNNGYCDGICINSVGSYQCDCIGNTRLYTFDGEFGLFIPKPYENGLQPWNLYHLNHTCVQTSTLRCPTPPRNINNGHLLAETGAFTIGDNITYLCDMGYRANGTTTLRCSGAGVWDAAYPVCYVATCPVPVIATGTVSPQSPIRYLEYYTVTCDLLGINQRTPTARCVYDENTRTYRVDVNQLRCDTTGVNCGVPKRLPGSLPYNASSTEFTFQCRAPLFTRVGQSSVNKNDVVVCGANGVWDFGDLRCEGPTCPDPGTNAGTAQVATTYEEFSLVAYQCTRVGFSLAYPWPLYCQYNTSTNSLMWNGTAPTCTDTEAPTFANCPTQVHQVSYLASALFAEPVGRDNVMVKELSVSPVDFRTTSVIENSMQVSYVAKDHQGNVGTCVVSIQVRDDSPPVIRCQGFIELQLNSESQRAVYDPLTFVGSQADNSGVVNFAFTINPLITDYFSTGNTTTISINTRNIGDTYTVMIEGKDPSGNSDSCLMQIRVTAPKCVPYGVQVENSATTCSQLANGGYRCDIKCNSGYKFYEAPDTDTISMTCNPAADWNRDEPVCTRWYYTNYRVEYQMDYRTRSEPTLACQFTYLQQLSTQMSSLTTALTSLCSSTNPPVTVTAAANINSVAVAPYTEGLYVNFRLDLDSNPNNQVAITQCANTTISAFTSVSSSLQSIRSLSQQGNCAASETVTYRQTMTNTVNCQVNQESRVEPATSRLQCVACPLGYTSAAGVKCSACSVGSYYDNSTTSCQFCPPGTNSQTTGARFLDDCYLHCPYGYISSTGLAPCSPCPENTYSLNRTYCQQCPAGLSTRGDAQGYPQNCLSPCQPGNYSFDGYSPCSQCPRGYFQDKARATTCTECSSNHTTQTTSSTSASSCVPAGPIVCNPNPCFNGTCTATDHDYLCLCQPGFTGRNCETTVQPCDSSPCYNDALCVNNGLDYQCVCSRGLTTGKNCETDLNDNCNADPCSNFGACQNLVGKHICLCPSFSRYTFVGLLGSDCTTLRNPCAQNPCVNSATCVNLNNIRHKCVCPDGYNGDSCENDIYYCGTSTNPCQNGASCRDGPGSQVTCSCAPGYTGQRCEVRLDLCDATVCGPTSTCVDNYLTDQAQCYCNQAYANVNGVCTAVVINPCESSPCRNNATCYLSQGSIAGYGCICPPGYEGQNCQHDIDDCLSKPCLNGGSCTDLVNGYRCACPPNTRAPVCQDAVDLCSGGTNPCSPLGTLGCVDYFNGYICNCLSGYYGVNCTEGRTNCASFPCRHGATCIDVGFSYQCKCPDGYQGSNCESVRNYCSSHPCFNGGLCVNTDTGTVCNCPPGYRGDSCETVYNLCTLANPCTVAGSVCETDSQNRPTCTCPSGYNGSYCEVKPASCATNTCQNGGECRDVNGQVTCICVAGYVGSRCETNMDECSSSPCTAGKVCVDGINSYTCECADNRIGDVCKELSVNFDLVLQPHSNFKTSERSTFSLGSSALTVATWVRFTDRTTPGTLLSLYGLSSQNSAATPEQILRMDRDRVVLNFAGARTFSFTPPIDDGYWHHVAFTWDGSTGQARLVIDNAVSSSATNYGQGTRLASYGWLILGGVYNSSTGMVDRSSGMAGRLSRLHVSTQALSTSDVSNLYSDFSLVPSGAKQALTKSLLVGMYSTVDYNSQLTLGYCRTQLGCRSIDQVTAQPSVISRPEDQMVQTDRQALPTWTSATFQSSDPVMTNYLSGSTVLDWGDYGVYYTQSDDDGDSAVCTFTLHNRRSSCVTPVPPRFGSQSCVTTASGLRCESQCSGTYTMSEASPRYYSCGQYSMFDQSERILQFAFPSCTTCKTPLHNLVMSLNFSVNTSPPCSTGQSQLPGSIRGTLNDINSKWQQGLCGTSCTVVRVDVTCPADASQGIATKVYLNSIQAVLNNFDSSLLRSASEILSIEMADNNAFTYPYASTILSSLVIDETKTCSIGNVLLGDCCIECGLGHYLNSDTGVCTACPRGTYLDQLGQTGSSSSTPCKTCPSGTITHGDGAQAETDCKTNCQFGRYYDETTGQCPLCPVGYYAENPGAFYCDPCPSDKTTLREGSTARGSCSVNPVATTAAPVTTPANSGGGTVGASTARQDVAWPEIILIILAIILIIFLVLIILFCYFRDHLVKACPCLITKVKPESKTGWHYVDRFGETRIKFASHKLSDVRARNSDQNLLNNSVEEGSVHTNISLQVPVFEEILNGQVTKKSLHMSDHNPSGEKKAKRKKKRRVRKTADLSSEAEAPTSLPLTPSHAAPAATELPADGSVRRLLSAFNRPRPTLEELPHENFVPPRRHNVLEDGGSTSLGLPPRSLSSTHQSSRIKIDSDEDQR